MDFRGHLRLPDDAGTGIPVLLRLDDIFVVISSGGDELGAWRADDVAIERIYSNQFAIELDGEPMVFVAQDALGFAYEGISAIESLQERLTKRRVFRRSKKKDKAETIEQEGTEPASTEPAEPRVVPTPSATAPPVPAVEETSPAPAVADHTEEPTLSGQPASIWTPPSATPPSRPAATAPSDPQPDFEPPIPEPIERRFASEDAGTGRPEDVRVSYAQPERPPAPAVESFVPPVEPHDPDEPALEPQEPAPPDQVPSEDAPAREAEPAATEVPEYEIEEVAPAASGVSWQPDDETRVEYQEPVVEMEIEDYVLPSAGAVETFRLPAVEADAEIAPSQLEAEPDVAPEVEADVSDRSEPGELTEIPEARQISETEGVPAAEQIAEEEPAGPDPLPAGPADTSDVAATSNGHREVDQVEQDSARRERRHSLFGRSRDKKIPPHEHRYGDPKTIGGLTRQVCEVCGHVTFSGEDVYQGW